MTLKFGVHTWIYSRSMNRSHNMHVNQQIWTVSITYINMQHEFGICTESPWIMVCKHQCCDYSPKTLKLLHWWASFIPFLYNRFGTLGGSRNNRHKTPLCRIAKMSNKFYLGHAMATPKIFTFNIMHFWHGLILFWPPSHLDIDAIEGTANKWSHTPQAKNIIGKWPNVGTTPKIGVENWFRFNKK